MSNRGFSRLATGANSGVYALILPVGSPIGNLSVGQLGTLDLHEGHYVYVGSALQGLRQRLERHARRTDKRRHWHIDYLVERVRPRRLLAWPTKRELECRLSRRVAALSDGSVEGFGCSDCDCSSHLYFFESGPQGELEKLVLREPGGDDIPPRSMDTGTGRG